MIDRGFPTRNRPGQRPESPGRAIATATTRGYLSFSAGRVLVVALVARTGLALAVGAAGLAIALVLLLAPAMRGGSAGGQP